MRMPGVAGMQQNVLDVRQPCFGFVEFAAAGWFSGHRLRHKCLLLQTLPLTLQATQFTHLPSTGILANTPLSSTTTVHVQYSTGCTCTAHAHTTVHVHTVTKLKR
jgi:hypothetical protein